MKSDTPKNRNAVMEDLYGIATYHHPRFFNSALTPKTELGVDLRIAGDDADDFFENYYERYQVDLRKLDLTIYFPGETTAELNAYLNDARIRRTKNKIVRFISLVLQHIYFGSAKTYPSITLEHLCNVAMEGEWYDPNEASK